MTKAEDLPTVDAAIDYATGYVDALKDCKDIDVAALIMERDSLKEALGSLIKYCEDHDWGTMPEPGAILDRAVIASPDLSLWYTPSAVREAGKRIDSKGTLAARASGDISSGEVLIMEIDSGSALSQESKP